MEFSMTAKSLLLIAVLCAAVTCEAQPERNPVEKHFVISLRWFRYVPIWP